jgi:hypothetical protein
MAILCYAAFFAVLGNQTFRTYRGEQLNRIDVAAFWASPLKFSSHARNRGCPVLVSVFTLFGMSTTPS